MTNHWVDIKNTDPILVDPRFNRSAAVSDFYAPIRSGTGIAFLGGVINYLLTHDKIHHEYVLNYTNVPCLVRDFSFEPACSPAIRPRTSARCSACGRASPSP